MATNRQQPPPPCPVCGTRAAVLRSAAPGSSVEEVFTFTHDLPQGRFISYWFIEAARRRIRAGGVALETLRLDLIAPFRGIVETSDIHLDHMDDSDQPIMVAETEFGALVIDGNHRLERAFRAGDPTIEAYIFTLEQARGISSFEKETPDSHAPDSGSD